MSLPTLSKLRILAINAMLDKNTVIQVILDPTGKWVELEDQNQAKIQGVYATRGLNGEIEPLECSICADALMVPKKTIDSAEDPLIACGHLHVYHRKCIRAWIHKGGQTCPDCRMPLSRDIMEKYEIARVKSPAFHDALQAPGAPMRRRRPSGSADRQNSMNPRGLDF